MALISAITFAGYTFPIGFRLAKRDHPAKIDDVEVLGLAGTHAPPSLPSGRTISLEGVVASQSYAGDGVTFLATKDDVNNEISRMVSALEGGTQALNVGTLPARQILAMLKDFAPEYTEGYGQNYVMVKCDLYAPDPRWLSPTARQLTASGVATNAGTTLSYPYAVFTGPGANPTLAVYPGSGSATGPLIEVAPIVTLGSSDVLVIDCDPRHRAQAVLLNGTPRLDLLGTTGLTNTVGNSAFFPYLLAGTNYVAVGGAASYIVQWPDAWGA